MRREEGEEGEQGEGGEEGNVGDQGRVRKQCQKYTSSRNGTGTRATEMMVAVVVV